MAELFGLAVLVFLLVLVAAIFASFSKKASSEFAYEKKSHILSPAERSFMGVLRNAVASDHIVLAKVRVADLLRPKKGLSRPNWQIAFNRISSKHIDFVICAAGDYSVLAAVELDDRSHNRSSVRRRDELLDKAAKSAGLPLLRFAAKRSYSVTEVREQIMAVVTNAP